MQEADWIERVFRQANEIIAQHLEALGAAAAGGFVCECADETCTDRLELPLAEFRRIHAHPNRFMVARGHDLPDVERLVEEHEGFVVVEKEPVAETSEADSLFRG